MSRPRIEAVLIFVLGGFVLFAGYPWIVFGVVVIHKSSQWLTFVLAVVCGSCVLVSMAASAGLAASGQPWNRRSALKLALAGTAVSLIGGGVYDLNAIMTSMAVHFGVSGARRSLLLCRIGLAVCAGTFLICTIGVRRAARTRT